jgi:hypothetical protein
VSDVARKKFGRRLEEHLIAGTSPKGQPRGKWSNEQFGHATGVTDTTVRNWRGGKNLPPSFVPIGAALFGSSASEYDDIYTAWNQELESLYHEAQKEKKEEFKRLQFKNISSDLQSVPTFEEVFSTQPLLKGAPAQEVTTELAPVV